MGSSLTVNCELPIRFSAAERSLRGCRVLSDPNLPVVNGWLQATNSRDFTATVAREADCCSVVSSS
jgi:hypothetical protein